MSYKKGIDVSEHNGLIDWGKVKAAGVEFAMIRGGYSHTVDARALKNLSECNRLGIPCGVYWFSYALTAAQAAQEAAFCLATIKPYRIEYPVAFDLENDSVRYAQSKGVSIGMTLASDMARAFLRAVKAAGYTAVNYTNVDYLTRYYDAALKDEFPVWLAQWPGGTPKLEAPPRACDIWQYTAKGKVAGIGTDVDLDVCYADYTPKKEEPEKEAITMTDKEVFDAYNRHAAAQPLPAWAKDEYQEAIAAGITDGTKPTAMIPRYQAAIMALRAGKV